MLNKLLSAVNDNVFSSQQFIDTVFEVPSVHGFLLVTNLPEINSKLQMQMHKNLWPEIVQKKTIGILITTLPITQLFEQSF